MIPDLNDVVGEIEQAFDGVVRGDGVSLHEADAIDSCETEEDCAAARDSDQECRWQDVPDDDISGHSSVLYFMDDLGARYYLPAYMIWSLRNYESSDSLSISHAASKLKTLSARLFDERQCNAIRSYLRYLVGRYDDEEAQTTLATYWGNQSLEAAEPGNDKTATRTLPRAECLDDQIRDLIRIRRFSKAIPLLEQALEECTDGHCRSRFLEMLGECHLQADREDESLASFQAAIAADPTNYTCNLALGHTFLIRNEQVRAMHCFSNAMEIAPQESASAVLGKIFGRPAEFADRLLESLTKDNFVVKAHLAIAAVYALSEISDKTMHQIERAVSRAGLRDDNLVQKVFERILEMTRELHLSAEDPTLGRS